MKTPLKRCCLFVYLALFPLMAQAGPASHDKIDILELFNSTTARPAAGFDPDLSYRVELLQKKIKALETLGFNMNSVVQGSEIVDEEKYQALKIILADYESLFTTVASRLNVPVYGNTTQPVHSDFTTESTQFPPHWSYVYVDFASVMACVMSSLAPVVHLIKGWISYRRTNQIPDLKHSSWLIIDFIGKSFILSFLLVQKLIQHVEITAYNFITPGATLIIETFVIANTVFFRYRAIPPSV